MNREDVIKLARESGIKSPDLYKLTVSHMMIETLERFFQAAYVAGAVAEREACAKVVEAYTGAWDDQGYALTVAIRARSKQ